MRDLAKLYYSLTVAILSSKAEGDIPHGRSGYYFAENDSQSWHEIASLIGQVGKTKGLLKTDEAGSITLKTAADAFFSGGECVGE